MSLLSACWLSSSSSEARMQSGGMVSVEDFASDKPSDMSAVKEFNRIAACSPAWDESLLPGMLVICCN